MKKIIILITFFSFCAEKEKKKEDIPIKDGEIFIKDIMDAFEVFPDFIEIFEGKEIEKFSEDLDYIEIIEKYEEGEGGEIEDNFEIEKKEVIPFCKDDKMCDDGILCTLDKCDIKSGKCSNKMQECPSNHPCIKGTCEEALGGCIYKFVSEKECENFEVKYSENFEKGVLGGFVVEDLAKNTSINEEKAIWQISSKRSYSGKNALYFGILSKGNFDNGKITASSAISPPITIKGKNPVRFIFFVYMDVEDGDAWDILSVNAKIDGKSIPLWVKGYGFQMKKWLPLEINLNCLGGGGFQIEFIFNSVDDSFNDSEGVYIDDIFIISKGEEIKCINVEECDDNIPCSDEKCLANRCEYNVNFGCCTTSAQCDDLDFCTVDICKNGGCEHFKIGDPACCNKDTDCEDKNECTIDTCKKNKCVYTKSTLPGCCEKDIECDDFDPCTIDKCEAKQCYHINTCCFKDEDCDDGDDICTKDYCKDKKCVFEPTGMQGCCKPEIALFNFDSYQEGWIFTNTTLNVGWQIVQGKKFTSASGSLYYGNPETSNYESGGANAGTATSPFINLPKGYPIELSFQLYMDTEQVNSFDKMFVKIATGEPKETIVWDKNKLANYKQFTNQKVDLTPWAGQTIQIKFVFDTVDSAYNYYEGIYLDDIKVTTTCVPL